MRQKQRSASSRPDRQRKRASRSPVVGEPRRGTYELFGWVPDEAEVCGWVGSRVWLVPEDRTPDAWLLEDAEIRGRHPGRDGLVLTGLDDHEGPPEGYRNPVRLHNGYRWLGTCRELARVLPPEDAAPPLVLRRLVPDNRMLRSGSDVLGLTPRGAHPRSAGLAAQARSRQLPGRSGCLRAGAGNSRAGPVRGTGGAGMPCPAARMSRARIRLRPRGVRARQSGWSEAR